MGFNPATYQYLYQGKPFTGEMCEHGVDGALVYTDRTEEGPRRGSGQSPHIPPPGSR